MITIELYCAYQLSSNVLYAAYIDISSIYRESGIECLTAEDWEDREGKNESRM